MVFASGNSRTTIHILRNMFTWLHLLLIHIMRVIVSFNLLQMQLNRMHLSSCLNLIVFVAILVVTVLMDLIRCSITCQHVPFHDATLIPDVKGPSLELMTPEQGSSANSWGSMRRRRGKLCCHIKSLCKQQFSGTIYYFMI